MLGNMSTIILNKKNKKELTQCQNNKKSIKIINNIYRQNDKWAPVRKRSNCLIYGQCMYFTYSILIPGLTLYSNVHKYLPSNLQLGFWKRWISLYK